MGEGGTRVNKKRCLNFPRILKTSIILLFFKRATRKGRVDEAVQYHKEAADILNELLQNILDEKVAESVRLQAQLHEKGLPNLPIPILG